MKVKDAIKQLKELDPNEEIIIVWWENQSFDLKKKDWKEVVEYIDSDFDWSATHEDIGEFIRSFFLDTK